jgi:PTH1 family peptidyl-tRNA hydrolase
MKKVFSFFLIIACAFLLIACKEPEVVITQEVLENLVFEDGVFDYNGEEHSIYVENEYEEKGVKISYRNNKQINPGTYTVEETEAPEGYSINKKPTTFTVESEKYDVLVKIGNSAKKVAVNIIKLDASTKQPLAGAVLQVTNVKGEKVLFVKPQTYMNLSGDSVREIAAYYNVSMEDVLVIYDDISLPLGKLRIRKNGSAGGHNGLKSVIECLSSDAFPRIKLGVGQKPNPDYDIADWVLARLPKEKERVFFKVLENMPSILSLMLKGETEKAMCDFNGISIEG